MLRLARMPQWLALLLALTLAVPVSARPPADTFDTTGCPAGVYFAAGPTGQVLTVPDTDTVLTEFSAVDVRPSGTVRFAVLSWDAAASRAVGTPLYLSDEVPVSAGVATLTPPSPGLALEPGSAVAVVVMAGEGFGQLVFGTCPNGTPDGRPDGGLIAQDRRAFTPADLTVRPWTVSQATLRFRATFLPPLDGSAPIPCGCAGPRE